MAIEIPTSVEEWNNRGADYLPGHLGMNVICVEAGEVMIRMNVSTCLMSWNGFLHGGSVVALADTACGYGTLKNLPDGASGFATIDLTSNFIGTALQGSISCTAKPLHLGRRTQVWDATVISDLSQKTMAHFRCTQTILRS